MTIYALSSGPGISGVAVVRVSGKETAEVVKKLTGEELPSPRVATLKKFNKIDTNELIDEGVIIWFPGPNSYTGEDLAEFHVHGSRAVVSALHSSISKIKNCRLAEPGEFTKIAFQNGKINLLKAESIADLVSSETEIQRKQAIKIMSGKSSDQFNSWREKLLKILSHVEAKIDFPDEDLPKDILSEIQKTSDQISSEIKKILTSLGCIIRMNGKKMKVLPPTWRPDIKEDIDLVEELTRIKGYDKVPLINPEKENIKDTLNYKQKLFHFAQRSVASKGYTEAVTWSFTDSKTDALFSELKN